MSAVAGFPRLSQLLAWPTEHLTEAADYWEAIGGRCYGAANQVWQDALSIDWQGDAADTLRTAAHTDMLTTSAVADQLHAAAKVARSGASDLYTARSRVRYAVEDARTAGFDVGEDLSVTDRSSGGSAMQRATRQAQAQTLAGDVRQRAAQLVAHDQQVAGKITAAVAGIRQTFPPSPAPDTPPRDNRVHAVDNHTFKQEPPPAPPYGNPFKGWTDDQKAQVATEIAHGHALEDHIGDFPRGWTGPDLTRWIYEAMNDPNTRFGTNIKSGALTLLRDGKIIFINPKGGDYGTVFVPKPRPGIDQWRSPLEYFEQNTRAVEPLPPPAPARLPPLTPGEMAPRVPPPVKPPPPAPKPVPPLEGGEGPVIPGGPGTPAGPTLAPPPHYHGSPVIGDPVEDPWDYDHHGE
jgi:hypothetical protein